MAYSDHGVTCTTPPLLYPSQHSESRLWAWDQPWPVKNPHSFKRNSLSSVTLTWHGAYSAGVWCLNTDCVHPRPRPWSQRPPSGRGVLTQHMTLPRFHMTSKDIQPFIIRKSYVTGTTERGRQRESDTKNRRCGNNHSAPPHIQPSAISNHFCCVILFAPKWGLNFHGLYHIVLCCTRLQREASGREQSEREGIYIYLVCGLMAPYVCEKK